MAGTGHKIRYLVDGLAFWDRSDEPVLFFYLILPIYWDITSISRLIEHWNTQNHNLLLIQN